MKTENHKIITYFILSALLLIISAKLLLGDAPSNYFLFFYGILVTTVLCVVFFIALVKYKDPYDISLSKPNATKKNYTVSIMVAVKNEENIIERCVKSLLAQDYKNKEIIIVNDGSQDNTSKILKKYALSRKIVLINLKNNIGKKKALGKAMLQARGDIFAFSDSDSILAPDAISKTVRIFESDETIGAISGHCRALNGDQNIFTKIQDSWYEGQFSIRKAFESYFGVVSCVSGPLAVFRKEAIYNYIPAWEHDIFLGQEFRFATDRTLTGFVLGSETMGEKLKKQYARSPFVKNVNYPVKNWKIVYTKAAKAWTNVPDTLSLIFKQQIRWKKSFIRNIFFTGLFFWKKPIIPAIVYYLHILFVFVGPLIAFRHLLLIPLGGNIFSAILYLLGIIFIGFSFGLAYKLENKDCDKWMYRPLMSLFSTLVLSWLIFYSTFTIKKMIWARK